MLSIQRDFSLENGCFQYQIVTIDSIDLFLSLLIMILITVEEKTYLPNSPKCRIILFILTTTYKFIEQYVIRGYTPVETSLGNIENRRKG